MLPSLSLNQTRTSRKRKYDAPMHHTILNNLDRSFSNALNEGSQFHDSEI